MTPDQLEQPQPKIDPNSPTWQAIKKWIEGEVRSDFLPALRSRNTTQDHTQYARGGYDALERLLQQGEPNFKL